MAERRSEVMAARKLLGLPITDVEYHISDKEADDAYVTVYPDDAYATVISRCLHTGACTLDVVVWTEDGARKWGGDDAVERYREDPDASVFERYEFTCNAVGRVP